MLGYKRYVEFPSSVLFIEVFPLQIFQGFHSRPRATPRPLHISPSSSAGTPHYPSHTLPSSGHRPPSPSNNGGHFTSSYHHTEPRRRMHPVGSDGLPKTMEPRKNGYYTNRSSFIVDSCADQSPSNGLKEAISKDPLIADQTAQLKTSTPPLPPPPADN